MSNSMIPTVTILSCIREDWVADSHCQGAALADLFGCSGNYKVETPTTALDFFYCWNKAGECVCLHFFGGWDRLIGHEGDDTPLLITKDQIAGIARNDRIRFVLISSGYAAAGDPNDNLAAWISKKINAQGIVIANEDNTWGHCAFYRGMENGETWKVYRDGKVIATIPQVLLTPKDTYEIYRSLCADAFVASKVTVVSCSRADWMADSERMGYDMSALFGAEKDYTVHSTKTALDFSDAWNRAGECVMIHTHGSPFAVYDEVGRDPSTMPEIISKDQVSRMSKNDRIKFVYISACSTAGGEEKNNFACEISKKIDPNGIVLANGDEVWGCSAFYEGKTKGQTWKVYKNGEVIATIPQVTLLPADVYKIYKSFT